MPCTCCDHVDQAEENFQGPRDAAKGAGERSGDPPPGAAATSASAGASSGGVPPEKSRLQEFVKDFAKCAVRGIPCDVIDSERGSVFTANYFIDPALQRLSLRKCNAGGTSEAPLYRDLDISTIQDIFDIDSATASGRLPEGVRNAVRGDGQKERLAVISFEDHTPAAFLLEGSPVDRDRFIMCVKILRLYAQTHGGTKGGS
mmetsp:Transcript_41068/g.116263  ORF Transcript_41068/g.116263 Transcript_41068/m.116263 type:complete len:202 (-) Transcript_41068:135-740(-)